MQSVGRQPRRAPDDAGLHDARHRPEQTTLYRLVQQHAASFIARNEASTGAALPRFVKDAFDGFHGCGSLAHGFLRLRGGECSTTSCRPSAAGAGDSVRRAVRQRVPSLPIPLRVLLDAQPERVTPVLQVAQRVVARHLLDGTEPKMLTRRGVLVEDLGQTRLAEPDADGEEARTPRPPQAAAVACRSAVGPRAGHPVPTLRGATPREATSRQAPCADSDGFSLHAAVRVEAHDRKRLEQPCRCITRPALPDERLPPNAAGQVELQLETP